MKKLIHIFALVGVALILPVVPSVVRAACPTEYQIVAPTSVSIDQSVPNGETLWTGGITVPMSNGNTCAPGSFTIVAEGVSTYLGNNLYATAIPGIAYRLQLSNTCMYGYFPSSCYGHWTGGSITGHSIQVELVKNGTIASGGTLQGQIARWRTPNGDYARYFLTTPITVIPSKPTCSVSTPSVNVQLGTVSSGSFGGIGTTSIPTAFNISLNCSGGGVGTVAYIYTTLTDQANPGNRSSTLPLAPGSTASGVGIQVLKSGVPLSFGPDSSAAGNPNQWQAGSSGNGTFTIPLSGRYIKTASTISPGTANGKLTFTMNYR
ncbi:fimbrial protein [Serratia fonticola]|uniref:fimbrial protein n=1 Tax=Serratia fonticola TaxID=47917 RepID=UPI00192D1110|nr:fimbrial protein [Serratia fonticola]MBL5825925.1 type 1 fimbrial protein [Serratia fonticola]